MWAYGGRAKNCGSWMEEIWDGRQLKIGIIIWWEAAKNGVNVKTAVLSVAKPCSSGHETICRLLQPGYQSYTISHL